MAAGISIHPGLKAAGVDPNMVDKLVEATKIPLETAKKRREKVTVQKEEFEKLNGLVSALGTSLNSLKTKTDFNKLKVESSHPDIIEGTVGPGALLGNYELEVKSIAKSEKELAYGFPDKDSTPVGFGFMMIGRDDKEPMEIVVEPYTTLEKLANQINDQDGGVKAMVINTGYKPDPFRLLVVSEESGKEAKISLDEDTTFLEFKEQVIGQNAELLFEDVPVTDSDNTFDELIGDVVLNVKKADPGTKVEVNVTYDVDKTIESIAAFVESYNNIADFVSSQFQENKETGEFGILASDSSIKMIVRQLQSALVGIQSGGGKFNTLAEIGIKTNPKTGVLDYDESKVREALSEDYDSVARLFVRGKDSMGVAQLMSDKIDGFKRTGSGVLTTKLKGFDRKIKSQDQQIERRERQITQREKAIRRQFTALESNLMNMQSQGDFLKSKFGGGKK